MKPSKKEDFPLMEVSAHENGPWEKAHVSWVFADGTCKIVDDYGTEYYRRFLREIKEPKMRDMTRDEMVIKACEPWGYAVRCGDSLWQPPSIYTYTDAVHYEWCDTTSGTFGEPQKFEVEV